MSTVDTYAISPSTLLLPEPPIFPLPLTPPPAPPLPCSYVEELQSLFDALPPSGPLPTDVDDTIEEADQLISELRVAAYGITDPAAKQTALSKTKSFMARLDDLKRRKLLSNSTGVSGDGTGLSDDSAERHAQTMARLEAARAQLYESEVTAQGTLENLNQQEETMRRVNANQKAIIAEQHKSDKLLSRMSKWWRT